MTRFARLLVVSLTPWLLADAAFAALYQVNVSGYIDKGSSPTFFGLTTNSIPFSFSLILDDSGMTLVPVGTDITGGPDYSDADYFLFPAQSVRGLSLTIGNSSWATTDLVTQPLGTTGANYAVLVSGDLSSNHSGVRLKLQNASGSFLDFSPLVCGSGSCSVREHQSTAFAMSEGAFGDIEFLQETISVLAVTMDWTPIGNIGNLCDPQTQGCFGSVSHFYQIAAYEVTNAQYAVFLNARAASDPLGLYNTSMGSGYGGITRSGSAGSYTYSAIAGREDMPVNFVSFYDALRFANWMNNGQASGDTESGAYTLLGNTETPSNGATVTRNAGATTFLPSEDEWYKAAYYSPVGTYFEYPTGSDAQTVCSTPTATANRANCADAVSDLTIKGSYPSSASPYGTFDQGGNLWEWNEAIISGSSRELRGGAFKAGLGAGNLAASFSSFGNPSVELDVVGFRIARIDPNLRLFQYKGNAFTDFTDVTPPNGIYTNIDRITALIALDGPLAPNLTNTHIDDQVLGFRMEDGRGMHDETTGLTYFSVSTDANGNITEWDLEASSVGSLPFATGEQEHTIRTSNQSGGFVGDFGVISECVNPSGCPPGSQTYDFGYDWGSNSHNPGTLPEPGTGEAIVAAVGALRVLAAWRRPRT